VKLVTIVQLVSIPLWLKVQVSLPMKQDWPTQSLAKLAKFAMVLLETHQLMRELINGVTVKVMKAIPVLGISQNRLELESMRQLVLFQNTVLLTEKTARLVLMVTTVSEALKPLALPDSTVTQLLHKLMLTTTEQSCNFSSLAPKVTTEIPQELR
jgi:hypothetical protein